ncbi:cellulose binding domain-containing protein [Streptomyces sp. NPDC093260]|uniref:cellulose binding domain-containing protein n=1 Tax=Streptomyces sp. NPDC093260 TaxID=3155073 RepID=UPI003416965D
MTAVGEGWNGSLGSGAGVDAGFLASGPAGTSTPTVFQLDGTACDVDPEPMASSTRS